VLDWWLDVPFDELQSPWVQFVCVASITSSPGSVQSFFNCVTALQDRVTYVVFRNLKDGDYLPDCDKSDQALAFRERFAPQPPSQRAAKPRRKRPMLVAGGFLSHSSTLRR